MTGASTMKLLGVLVFTELLLLLAGYSGAEAEQEAANPLVNIIDPYRNDDDDAGREATDDDDLSDVLSQLSQTDNLQEQSDDEFSKRRPIGSTLQTSARTLCGLSLKLLSGHDKQKTADSKSHISKLLMHTSRLCTHLSAAESSAQQQQQQQGPLDLFVAGITAFCTQLDKLEAEKEKFHGDNKNVWELAKAVCSHRPSTPAPEERHRDPSQSEAVDFCRGVVMRLVERSKRDTGATSYGVLLMHAAAMCGDVPRQLTQKADGDADTTQEASPMVKVAAGHFCKFLPKILSRHESKEREERFADLAMKSSQFCS